MKFERLSAPTLKSLFVSQLQDKILSGEIPIGTALPPERELAAQMQVSRAVVNSGLAELAEEGFLEIQPRRRTFVSDYRRNGNISTLIALMEYHGVQLDKSLILGFITAGGSADRKSVLFWRSGARWNIWLRSRRSYAQRKKN